MELIVAMEEHFGIEITNPDAEKIHGVLDAIQIFHGYVTKAKQVSTTEGKAEWTKAINE